MGLGNYASSGDQSLTDAVNWLRDLLLGSIGTMIAVLAIAGIGLLMLSGRLPIRRGVTAILGCFILFSAGTIAGGLINQWEPMTNTVVVAPEAPAYTATIPTPAPYDPFEGAAVPVRPQRDILQ
ncbi:TrbC/VirB2 family protein [Caenibius sp. WL]|uniref:TrbC/VirB2 family protein n=1 Tax=Caenibius sp. WL TaxID=2872646 RepID=UPI001C99E5F7|nr:TrbC/VirB2 family protein [Caenibius sp. WL]QZP09149.1 TrbC/VirB2 family protein [Caenibius sp. WL]